MRHAGLDGGMRRVQPVGPGAGGVIVLLAARDAVGCHLLGGGRPRPESDCDQRGTDHDATSLGPTSAKYTPCGSRATAMKAGPGTSIGPCTTSPPPSRMRSRAAATPFTPK